MKAYAELLPTAETRLIRVYAHEPHRFGDPYEASCIAIGAPPVAEIRGLVTQIPFTRDMREAILGELRAQGFGRFRWERRKGGRRVGVEAR